MANGNFTKDDSYKNLERVNYFIANSDTKTSFVLAFVGVLIAAFFTSGLIDEGFKSLITLISQLKWADLKGITAILTVIAFVAFLYYLVMGTLKLIAALTAKTDLNEFPDPNLGRNSNLFFMTIAAKSFDQFSQDLNHFTDEELITDINSQTYINSRIASIKFQNYNNGLKNIKYAVFAFIAFAVLLFVVRAIAPAI